VRGNHIFGERLHTPAGNMTPLGDEFRNQKFFSNIGNLNMGDNSDATAAANANAAPYVFLSFVFQIFLELQVLVFVVDAIGLYCLDAIYSSTLLVCMISFIICLCDHAMLITCSD
jgi:hypothetical protein